MMTIHGKASHAGNAHKEGINAIQEMAAEILKIQALTDYEAGTTVNVGICQGGTKVNVVPAAASFSVDAAINLWRRARGSDGRSWNCRYLFLVRPGRWRSWKGSFPWRRPRGTMELFAAAKECGRKLGLSFSHQFVGGGSDGNAVSAMGIPTLDGLGGWGTGLIPKANTCGSASIFRGSRCWLQLILDIR